MAIPRTPPNCSEANGSEKACFLRDSPFSFCGQREVRNEKDRPSVPQLQETYLRPALERLLPVMEISAFGCDARDAHIVFEPMAAIAPSARTSILQQLSSTMNTLYQSGLVSAEAALEELRSQGRLFGVFANLQAPPNMPSPPTPPSL